MPFTKILIHAVWATKDRKPLMNKENKDALCQHIREYAKSKSIYLLNVNGWLDHLHCLISMSSDQNIATVMGLIKGESSFWASKNLNFTEKFGWQDDYFAVSIGESRLQILNNYIDNQEEHHKKKTFQQEYEEFIKKYDFKD
ncbi:MAG: IS200/IS605 family transposase [Chryseotalea sp. WA131a]|jgi:REP element-mobilizing transposase RayT|nr:MAG: IS200/IS605 family transposase [Chryseotalea sp. WA131a]